MDETNCKTGYTDAFVKNMTFYQWDISSTKTKVR